MKTFKITTIAGFSFDINTNKYTFAHDCYIINGVSYPKEIVTEIA